VAPFPTVADDVTWDEIKRFWAGDHPALAQLSGDGTPPTLYVTADVLAALEALLGSRSTDAPVTVVEREGLVDTVWAARPHAWAIVPFDELEPRWKVLRLDGASLLDKTLDISAYPLVLALGIEGPEAEAVAASLKGATALTNRDTARMTTLIMTGCTALVRATAFEMEAQGVLYPAAYVGDLLRSADITHISNEIPFAKNCPFPDRNQEALVFCSDPRYIELLRAVSTDVVELTGNHFQDWGSEATLETLEMYRQEGWPYFGGGANLTEAKSAITLESSGNSFSFIGCNPVGPTYAWATDDRPGAAPCDWEYMHSELTRLKAIVDVPIATFQYWEHYQYGATEQQQIDFRGMVDAGAAIVNGSQSHHPQGFEFYNGGFIHYGPGNLFFDQMWSLGTRQEVIDRHVIYAGRHISTELNTYMLENYSQPRPMTQAERSELLTSLFVASGW
jgi:poly-gamma-glutamate synthesis protein (capsule biosynthesis protein)